jgi:DNA (cytosine-5)-methyltransferase 1
MRFNAVEFCAGGGGQALGLEMAGFDCVGAVEIDSNCCATLRANRPRWDVRNNDMRTVSGSEWRGVDLFAAGVPCPPFSIAGKQLGENDERDMFPEALRLIEEIQPKAVMLENVKGFASSKFQQYRMTLFQKLCELGYQVDGRILQASDFSVPQLRPRFIIVAMHPADFLFFEWPEPFDEIRTVGPVLEDLMGERGWDGVDQWVKRADRIAPTIVGGSKKHGGPDLGPTRAKQQWRELGVDGLGIADTAPDGAFSASGFPRLTVRMVARIQSFPDSWQFSGGKSAAYRQVGNALPPLVAQAVGYSIFHALHRRRTPIRKRNGVAEMRLMDSGNSKYLVKRSK